MSAPIITSLEPPDGPATGRTLVLLHGSFAPNVAVRFGAQTARSWRVRANLVAAVVPASPPDLDGYRSVGPVDVTVLNVDSFGAPIPGQSMTVPAGYRYGAPELLDASLLERVVRAFIRLMKDSVLETTVLTTHTDFDDLTTDQIRELARLPALILTGPDTPRRHDDGDNVPEKVDLGDGIVLTRQPPRRFDVRLQVNGVSESVGELLNLQNAYMDAIDAHPWLEVGDTRFDLDAEEAPTGGTAGTGESNIRQFSASVVIRSVPLDSSHHTILGISAPVALPDGETGDPATTGPWLVQHPPPPWPNKLSPSGNPPVDGPPPHTLPRAVMPEQWEPAPTELYGFVQIWPTKTE